MVQDQAASMRRRAHLLTPVVALAAFIACTSTATAATYNVRCGSVYGKQGLLRAVTRANRNGGTVNLDECTYVITRTATTRAAFPRISRKVIINGDGATLVRASKAPALRFFIVDKGGKLDIRDLILRNGFIPAVSSGGGAINVQPGGSLRLFGSTLRNNHVSQYGGAILTSAGSTMRIIDSRVAHNTAHLGGGGGIASEGHTTIVDSEISANHVTISGDRNTTSRVAQGGGIVNFAKGVMAVTSTSIDHNSASANGANAYAQAGGIGNFGRLTLSDSWVGWNSTFAAGSHATAGAAGIGNRRGTTDNTRGHGYLRVERDTTVAHNTAKVSGSGAFVAFAGGLANAFRGRALVTDTDVRDNRVVGNGAHALAVGAGVGNGDLTNSKSVITIRRSSITDNAATGHTAHGGGIGRFSGSVFLSRTVVRHNSPDQCYPRGSVPHCTR